MNLRVMVVDDSILFRTVVADALRLIQGVEVIGTAATGRAALAKIAELKPDLITLDIEMPEMNGLQVLDEIKKNGYNTGVIIVSSITVQGGNQTIQAIEKGAFDFITKPSDGNPEQNKKTVYNALTPRIKSFVRKKEILSIIKGNSVSKKQLKEQIVVRTPQINYTDSETTLTSRIRILKPEILLIGVSTGGPVALATLLPGISANIGIPIVIVQHMPPMFTNALADNLRSKCSINVREAINGDILNAGTAYIAPGGKQVKLNADNNRQKIISITDDPPENNCKPSVDYTFRSAAYNFPGKSMAVILTGMGSDGTIGLKLLKRQGCFVIAQDEATCVVYGMPKSAVEARVVDVILPLEEIAPKIMSVMRKGV